MTIDPEFGEEVEMFDGIPVVDVPPEPEIEEPEPDPGYEDVPLPL